MAWFRRAINLLRPTRLARDIQREVDFHVAERVDELVAGGMPEAAARREARRRFGNPEVLTERTHDVDVLTWLESVLDDLRYALRALGRHPGFAAAAVLSLGLGIGANTAIFSLVNAVMLRTLPVTRPDELAQIIMQDRQATFTNPLWEAIRDQRVPTLAGAFAFADQRFNLATEGPVQREAGALVSGDYFRVLGVRAVLGRVLGPADDVRGCPGAVVLSHDFWRSRYGGAADVVGRTLPLDGHPLVIVGVAQPGFSGIHVGRAVGVFAPICTIATLREGRDILDARSTWFINVFGRLRPDASLAQARAALAAVARPVFEATVPTHWAPDEQAAYMEGTLSAIPAGTGLSVLRGQYRTALFTLLAVVGLVLLVACANVAQLLLARATARRHEIAVRMAIGSGRGRLIRQLLTESMLLALLGATVGLVFARWSSGLLVGFLSTRTREVWLDLSLDWRVLGFTVAVATATGLLFGLAPAWRSARVSPQAAMRSAGRGVVGHSRQRIARAIVVGQVALSLVLVMAAGLLVGSFQRLATLDPGFRRDGVLIVEANWARVDVPDSQPMLVARELLERLRAVPGVRSAGASLVTPIGGSAWNEYVVVDGYTPPAQRDALVWFNGVTDGFFATLGTSVLAGRAFGRHDGPGAPPVVLVNEAMARRFFGDPRPLGKRFRVEDHEVLGPLMEIVGVVEDAKYRTLGEEVLPTAYVPLEQTELWAPAIELSLRAEGPPAALIPAATAAMREVSPRISLEFATLDAQVAESLALPRLLATLSGFFGGLALLLAVVGLYGTTSYSVARRRNEIGVRMALGAARTGILRMVAGEVGLIIAAGVVLGALLALAVTRTIGAFLYGVAATDPATFALSSLVLALAATTAGLVPAWRAARVDPMAALREE